MKIYFLGYHYMDFPDRQDPTRRVQGYNLYFAQESSEVVGVIPVSNGGKRFLSAAKAGQLGITQTWLNGRLGDFVNVEIDFDGKIVSISDCSENKSAAV